MNLARTYPGTEELVATIVAESQNHPSWRPGRAGALVALAGLEEHVWMKADEFASWVDVNSWAARRRKEGITPIQAIGMSPKRKLQIIRGERQALKVEALACAHYAMRLPVPCLPGDVAGFAAWCGRTFGGTNRLSDFLHIKQETITDRIRGFDIVEGERSARLPEIGLIRAMAWVAHAGPFCPYGDPPDIQVWPGQEV